MNMRKLLYVLALCVGWVLAALVTTFGLTMSRARGRSGPFLENFGAVFAEGQTSLLIMGASVATFVVGCEVFNHLTSKR